VTDAGKSEPTGREMSGQGIVGGLEVLDLSWGVAGPMTGMLLADHGAGVTRIEAPAGDPFADFSGTRVWLRGKRRATLDLRDEADREVFLALARRADVVIESFGPGVAAQLGIDHATLLAANPRLIHCSITGYGETGKHAHRPAYDALVAARTGQQFESRGAVGTTIGRLSHAEICPGRDAPDGQMIGAPRPGPLFSGLPWISLATSYNASVAINAALLAREITGLGKHVHTSMLQGSLATTVGTWQRVEHADREGFNSWVFDPRAPKGFFKGSDGRWTHHWVALPRLILNAAELDELEPGPALSAPRDAPPRVSPAPEGMAVLHEFHNAMRDAVAKFPAEDWVRLAAQVGAPVQRVRSPEEALRDPEFARDGSVVEVEGMRMVGHAYGFEKSRYRVPRRTRPREHTTEVKAEANASLRRPSWGPGQDQLALEASWCSTSALPSPAFGTQPRRPPRQSSQSTASSSTASSCETCFRMSCSRGKRSIAMTSSIPTGSVLRPGASADMRRG
jgi:crotonobetainyl-CoA:carnitine CoA-transferase CaiB-like acyl-CoA transferase